jgi:hypothetical protein
MEVIILNTPTYIIKKLVIETMLKINKIKHSIYLKNEVVNSIEKKEALSYIKTYGINTFTNDLSREYLPKSIEVFDDNTCKMKYVDWNGKKMYMPKGMCDQQIKEYISFLYSEQDIKSPHSYSTVQIPNGAFIADIGAAEGNFSLDNIEAASKIYIFEANRKWIPALEKTFEPYKDKVIIFNSYVGKLNTLDSYLLGYFRYPNILKIDAEGAEEEILTASSVLKRSEPITIIAAAYHNGDDDINLERIFSSNGFDVRFTKGFLMFLYKIRLTNPILRRGLCIATKA